MNPRAIAIEILLEVFTQHSHLDDAIAQQKISDLSPTDLALTKALSFGVCRFHWQLAAIANKLLQKPFKSKDQDVLLIVLLGLYQLLHTRIPDHAAVAQTVAIAKLRNKSWASAVVNAVLRRFQRERDAILKSIENDPVAMSSHPQWLLQRVQQSYPDQWQAIIAANNQQAPMYCRVNLAKISREDYLAECEKAEIVATACAGAASAIVLDQACSVNELPGFSAGWVSVQDLAAQLTPEFLELKSGLRILDACAAPGGKLCHLLETQADLILLALDKDPKRCQRIHENLQRLQLHAEVKSTDAAQPDLWWDGEAFDRILLDAPCSATGVIRRHPEIKLLRKPEQIEAVIQQQKQLLTTLWPLLKPGGILLYVTCSILPSENVDVINDFLQQHLDAECIALSVDPSLVNSNKDTEPGLQLLPGITDGFYYCKLQKRFSDGLKS